MIKRILLAALTLGLILLTPHTRASAQACDSDTIDRANGAVVIMESGTNYRLEDPGAFDGDDGDDVRICSTPQGTLIVDVDNGDQSYADEV